MEAKSQIPEQRISNQKVSQASNVTWLFHSAKNHEKLLHFNYIQIKLEICTYFLKSISSCDSCSTTTGGFRSFLGILSIFYLPNLTTILSFFSLLVLFFRSSYYYFNILFSCCFLCFSSSLYFLSSPSTLLASFYFCSSRYSSRSSKSD